MKHGQKIQYIYADGSCIGNPGPGGWAWALTDGEDILDEGSGNKPDTTCNEMELVAVYEALAHVSPSRSYIMVLDSQYAIDSLSKWYKNWQKNGWRNSKKQPVKNQDVIKSIIALYPKIDIIKWEWVKGHSGDRFNDHVDAAATTQSGQIAQDRSFKIPTHPGHSSAEETFRQSVNDATEKFIKEVQR